MKKLIYFCAVILFGMNAFAQFDPDDPNWEQVFCDEFTNNSWDTWNYWKISHPVPVGHYKAYLNEMLSGVTHGNHEHQVYQRENCQFGNGELKLVSVYVGGQNMQPLQCGDYDVPPGRICDTTHRTLFYTSGNVETENTFLYGYFEIKCSLPIHSGSFPAFWLWGEKPDYYNEIDIFEYSNGIAQDDYYKQFTCGMFCDNYTDTMVSYARVYPVLPNNSTDLRQFHVFSCEWMPDRVTWYVDGAVVNEFTDYEHIPHHEMTLKVNYAINDYAMSGQNGVPTWFDGDEMNIDYIKVYQLKTDCDEDVLITDTQDLVDYQSSIKQSVSIVPATEFTVPTNTNIYIRAVDSIVIDKGFTIPQGAQMTFQTQLCPELQIQ